MKLIKKIFNFLNKKTNVNSEDLIEKLNVDEIIDNNIHVYILNKTQVKMRILLISSKYKKISVV